MNLEELFIKLLKFKSITPNDDNAFEFIDEYFKDFDKISIDKNGVKNRFYYKKYGDGDHLCFAGHIDVVPAGDGWDSDAFEPIKKDGYIYARGTQDMKSGVAAFMDSIKSISTFNGTISILLTSDEEGDAKYGTVEVLKNLKKIDFLPKYVVVAEPTSESVFSDAIKVGRRGSINGVLNIYGVQGHAAYPEKSINPINLIAPILPKISNYDLDDGDEYFAPSKFVITDIRSGLEVTNVTPGVLKMMFNVRNSTKTTKDDIESFINRYFQDIKYDLVLSQSAKPFVTNKESKIVKNMLSSIESISNLDSKMSTAGGTSDARFFGEFGVDVVEVGVINDRIHAPNERTSLKDVESLRDIFINLIKCWR